MKPKEKAIEYLKSFRKRMYNPSNSKTKEFNPQLTTIYYFYVYKNAIDIALEEQSKQVFEKLLNHFQDAVNPEVLAKLCNHSLNVQRGSK